MIVFGSYAQGTATQESDVDVIVVSNDFKKLRSPQRLRVLDTASRYLKPEIVAAGFTKAEMDRFGTLTIVGQARENGLRFTPRTLQSN